MNPAKWRHLPKPDKKTAADSKTMLLLRLELLCGIQITLNLQQQINDLYCYYTSWVWNQVFNVCTADNNIFFVSVDITALQNCCCDDHRNVRSAYYIKNSHVQSAMATRPTWRVSLPLNQNRLTRIVPDYVHQITSIFPIYVKKISHTFTHSLFCGLFIHCFL
jgi:hypothetical protein